MIKAVDDSLAAVELIPEWFVTSKMIEKPFAALFVDDNILYFDEESVNAVFSCNEIGIVKIDINNINNSFCQ